MSGIDSLIPNAPAGRFDGVWFEPRPADGGTVSPGAA